MTLSLCWIVSSNSGQWIPYHDLVTTKVDIAATRLHWHITALKFNNLSAYLIAGLTFPASG